MSRIVDFIRGLGGCVVIFYGLALAMCAVGSLAIIGNIWPGLVVGFLTVVAAWNLLGRPHGNDE